MVGYMESAASPQDHGMAQVSKKGSMVIFCPFHPQCPSAWQTLRYKVLGPIKAFTELASAFPNFLEKRPC